MHETHTEDAKTPCGDKKAQPYLCTKPPDDEIAGELKNSVAFNRCQQCVDESLRSTARTNEEDQQCNRIPRPDSEFKVYSHARNVCCRNVGSVEQRQAEDDT